MDTRQRRFQTRWEASNFNKHEADLTQPKNANQSIPRSQPTVNSKKTLSHHNTPSKQNYSYFENTRNQSNSHHTFTSFRADKFRPGVTTDSTCSNRSNNDRHQKKTHHVHFKFDEDDYDIYEGLSSLYESFDKTAVLRPVSQKQAPSVSDTNIWEAYYQAPLPKQLVQTASAQAIKLSNSNIWEEYYQSPLSNKLKGSSNQNLWEEYYQTTTSHTTQSHVKINPNNYKLGVDCYDEYEGIAALLDDDSVKPNKKTPAFHYDAHRKANPFHSTPPYIWDIYYEPPVQDKSEEKNDSVPRPAMKRQWAKGKFSPTSSVWEEYYQPPLAKRQHQSRQSSHTVALGTWAEFYEPENHKKSGQPFARVESNTTTVWEQYYTPTRTHFTEAQDNLGVWKDYFVPDRHHAQSKIQASFRGSHTSTNDETFGAWAEYYTSPKTESFSRRAEQLKKYTRNLSSMNKLVDFLDDLRQEALSRRDNLDGADDFKQVLDSALPMIISGVLTLKSYMDSRH